VQMINGDKFTKLPPIEEIEAAGQEDDSEL
jgi:hypothetical protein